MYDILVEKNSQMLVDKLAQLRGVLVRNWFKTSRAKLKFLEFGCGNGL